MSVSEYPPCRRCLHSHEAHQHHHNLTYCSEHTPDCGCRQYQRARLSKTELTAMLAAAMRTATALRQELAQVKRDLMESRNREITRERALANVAALAPYCEATLDMSGPRIPGQRSAA